MSDRERYGTRCSAYSNWHRIDSIQRFVGPAMARHLTMIDVDSLEYCSSCRKPVAVIETARDVGQAAKPSLVTLRLAQAANVPGFTLLYTLASRRFGEHPDIERFRVKVIAPIEDREWRFLSPEAWARWIVRMHERCDCRPQLRQQETVDVLEDRTVPALPAGLPEPEHLYELPPLPDKWPQWPNREIA